MHRILFFLFFLLTFNSEATAQNAEEQQLTINPSGEAYLRAVRLRGIDTDVAYFDPTAPPPPLDTNQKPEPTREETNRTNGIGSAPSVLSIISAAILAGIVFLFFRYGGSFSVSMKGDAENPSRRAKSSRMTSHAINDLPSDLATILKMKNRRDALVTLAQSALARAVVENGLLMQKSWTARDALRRLPKDQLHRGALADLVAAGERVHFGGRDVPEDVFNEYVTKIKPLFFEAAK